MKRSLLGPLVLLVFISIKAYGSRQYIVFNHGLTWSKAQDFCQSHYTHLATFITQSDVESLNLKEYMVWIGLHEHRHNWWKWSNEEQRHYHRYNFNWGRKDLHTGSCAAVYFSDKKFYRQNCDTHLMFVCQHGTTYTFVTEPKTWSQALKHCEDHYDDLAHVKTSSMSGIFTELDFPIWTGLHRPEWDSNTYYVNWTETGPDGEGDCVTISSLTKRMETKKCDIRLPFICYWDGNINLRLVQEKKTWEEALEHCRGLNGIGLRFDLVSAESTDDYANIMQKVMEANTHEVWTGLRFLGDDWLWVDGRNTFNIDLPQCPTQEQRCGALSKNNTGSVESRDCSEQKNFICYSFTT